MVSELLSPLTIGKIYATQDKGVFLFLHILNEILWYIEILKQFNVGNHWLYF